MKTFKGKVKKIIDHGRAQIAEIRQREEHVDKTTALRQLLYKGVEDYALELYKNGRISVGKASELMHKNVHEVIELAEKREIIASATLAQTEKSLHSLKSTKPKTK